MFFLLAGCKKTSYNAEVFTLFFTVEIRSQATPVWRRSACASLEQTSSDLRLSGFELERE